MALVQITFDTAKHQMPLLLIDDQIIGGESGLPLKRVNYSWSDDSKTEFGSIEYLDDSKHEHLETFNIK